MALKRLKENAPFPDDFWNYNICPITGWYLKKDRLSFKYLKNDRRQERDKE